jgi:hypothetical protein
VRYVNLPRLQWDYVDSYLSDRIQLSELLAELQWAAAVYLCFTNPALKA